MIDKKVKLSLMYELENLHHVVVQASDVGSKYVYALQLLHKQTDTVVYRTDGGSKHAVFDENEPIVYLTGAAGGHTQTWTYSGEKDRWFIGTKPKSMVAFFGIHKLLELSCQKAELCNMTAILKCHVYLI